jgi:NAD-dependent deacetylase
MGPGSTLGLIQSKLSSARSITVLTGAGISADSGVPTFRGTDGLWKNFRAQDLATPEAFERDPRLVWEWYNWRRELIATKRPNPAHDAVAQMEQQFDRFWLITQNVDGLHRDAGSRKLSEIHGNIWTVRCTKCGCLAENRDLPIAIPPLCGSCGGLLRPHIVWFGESLAEEDLRRSETALQSSDLCLIIGTSGLVYPAAGFASIAKQAGAFVAEINLDPTPHTGLVDASLQGRAKDIVPLLLQA